MLCNNCRMKNTETAKFCVACGAPLKASSAMPTEAPAEDGLQETTVEATNYTGMPPVAQPYEATAQDNPYDQSLQQLAQPSTPNVPCWKSSVLPQNASEQPVSFRKWMGIVALEMFFGLAHFILLFVWGFSSNTEESLKNYARARLLWVLIIAALLALLYVIIFVIIDINMKDILSKFSSDPYMYY